MPWHLRVADQRCPAGWVGPHRNTCYKLITDNKLGWREANSGGCQAVDSRAHLAAVTYNNKAFLSKQTPIFMDGGFYWVGLRSGDTEWNQGTSYATPVDYTNWERLQFVEPDGSAAMENDCVLVNGRRTPSAFQPGKWADWNCNDPGEYLCQLVQVRPRREC